MFCEHYYLPQVKSIESIKKYFHTFPFQDWFVIHLLTWFFKDFIVFSDLFKSNFEKSSKENS